MTSILNIQSIAQYDTSSIQGWMWEKDVPV